MGFIHDHEEILGKIIEQRKRRLPGLAAVKITGVVFNSLAIADLAHHFDVIQRALLDALRLKQLVLRLELLHALPKVLFDLADRALQLFPAGGIMGGREHRNMLALKQDLPGERIHLGDTFDLVPEEFHTQRLIRPVDGENIQHIALRAEGAARKVDLIALILNIHQPADDFIPFDLHSLTQGDRKLHIFYRVTQRINARNRRHNDYVLPLVQGAGGAVAQFVDLIVDGGNLFEVCVGRGNIRLRLIVVVIRYEILHCAVREEFPKLGAELRGEGLVVRNDERGLLHPLDHFRHGKGFSAAGDAQQHLRFVTAQHARRELLNGLRLIALRFKRRHHLEFVHIIRSVFPQYAPVAILPKTARKRNCAHPFLRYFIHFIRKAENASLAEAFGRVSMRSILCPSAGK